MTQDTVLTLEQAMEAASASITNFKRFIEALDKFLKAHELGSVEYSAEYSAVSFTAGDHGYDIAMIHLNDQAGKRVVYYYVYTDGTVQGENFSDNTRLQHNLTESFTYTEAAEELLKTVGVWGHSILPKEKIDRMIEILAG